MMTTYANLTEKFNTLLDFHERYSDITQFTNLIPMQNYFKNLTKTQLQNLTSRLHDDMEPLKHAALDRVFNETINENYPYVMPSWLVYFIGISGVILGMGIWTCCLCLSGVARLRIYLVAFETRLMRSVSLLLTEAFKNTFQQLTTAQESPKTFDCFIPPDVSYQNFKEKLRVTPTNVPIDLRKSDDSSLGIQRGWCRRFLQPSAPIHAPDNDRVRVARQLEGDYYIKSTLAEEESSV
jgi:sorbitol-specific phosphotransferase system component IIC